MAGASFVSHSDILSFALFSTSSWAVAAIFDAVLWPHSIAAMIAITAISRPPNVNPIETDAKAFAIKSQSGPE